MAHVARHTAVAALTAAMVLGFPTVAAAVARDVVDSGAPGHLIVEVEPGEFDVELDAGESDEWLVTVRTDAPSAGAVTFDLVSSGPLAQSSRGAWLSIEECPQAWAGAPGATSCASSTTLIPVSPFAQIDTAARDLGTLEPGDERHLRLRVGVPADAPGSLNGTRADFAMTIRGFGTSATIGTTTPGGAIALTGADTTQPLIVASALVIAGLMLLILVRSCFREETAS